MTTTTLDIDYELARELKISPEVMWYMTVHVPETFGVTWELPKFPPKFKTPEAGEVLLDAEFDWETLDRLIFRVMPQLTHTKGKWAGRPLRPDPWQVAYVLAPVYGWKRADENGNVVRVVRTEYLDVPRKAGKTTLAGAQAIILLAADGEAGAEVYAAAAGKDQARFCFGPVKAIAEKSPALKKRLHTTVNRIINTSPNSYGSYFAVVSSVADLMHGANVHGAIIDELHVHKSRDLVDAIETGTGARDQPLVVIITTPDDGRPATIYNEKRTYCERLARGVIEDPSFYGVIFGIDNDADPFDESVWPIANPGIGISPTYAFLRQEAKKAQENPANLARFKRLHLGLRTKQETKFIDLPEWDRNASMVVEEKLHGKDCYGGLDLAAVSDLCALCWIFPDLHGGHDAIWRLWMPEARLSKLDERTAGSATAWVNQGFLTLTPGKVTDYEYIKAQIKLDADRFNVLGLGYDPWNSSQLVIDLENEGMPMTIVRQGYGTLSSPTKELHRLLMEGTSERPRFRHGGNPAMRWQIDNFAVAMDPSANVKPDKNAAGDKIDGVVAAIMALDQAMRHLPPKVSVYESHGLELA